MGATQLIQSGATPTIRLQNIEGNLTLSGWDRPEIQARVRGGADTLVIEQQDGRVTISCEDDLWLQTPVQSAITIGSVEGNAAIDLILNGTHDGHDRGQRRGEQRQRCHRQPDRGQLHGAPDRRRPAHRRHRGERADRQESPATSGLGQVEGNLLLDESRRAASTRRAEGNVRVQADAGPWPAVHDSRRRGHHLRESRATPAASSVLTAEGRIQRARPGRGTQRASNGVLNFERDTGARPADASGGGQHPAARRAPARPRRGRVRRRAGGGDGAALGRDHPADHARRSRAQVNELSRQLDDKLARLGTNEELATSIQEKVQSAMRRAEEKLAEALRKVEQRTQEAESRRRKSPGWAAPPAPRMPPAARPRRPSPSAPPTTDEERMLILRMVEQGKLSVEQAEKAAPGAERRQTGAIEHGGGVLRAAGFVICHTSFVIRHASLITRNTLHGTRSSKPDSDHIPMTLGGVTNGNQ
jgi:hypothetical protein